MISSVNNNFKLIKVYKVITRSFKEKFHLQELGVHLKILEFSLLALLKGKSF